MKAQTQVITKFGIEKEYKYSHWAFKYLQSRAFTPTIVVTNYTQNGRTHVTINVHDRSRIANFHINVNTSDFTIPFAYRTLPKNGYGKYETLFTKATCKDSHIVSCVLHLLNESRNIGDIDVIIQSLINIIESLTNGS